jgi:hypothetical protein
LPFVVDIGGDIFVKALVVVVVVVGVMNEDAKVVQPIVRNVSALVEIFMGCGGRVGFCEGRRR